MAPVTRSQQSALDFDVHNDHHDIVPEWMNAASSYHKNSSNSRAAVLSEIPTNNVTNINNNCGVDSLAAELESFHIRSPAKENIGDKTKSREQARRSYLALENQLSSLPSIGVEIQQGLPSGTLTSTNIDSGFDSLLVRDLAKRNPLGVALYQLPSNQEQFAKHNAGQFEWVLSVPIFGSGTSREARRSSQLGAKHPVHVKKLYFGCNLIHRGAAPGGGRDKDGRHANTYTLIATPIEGDETVSIGDTTVAEKTGNMSTTEVIDPNATVIRMIESPGTEIEQQQGQKAWEHEAGERKDEVVEQILAVSPSVQSSRIEDSVEALDRLEEQLEALNEVTSLGTVLSPEAKGAAASINAAVSRSSARTQTEALAKKIGVKGGSSSVRVKPVQRTSSVRKSTSMTFNNKVDKPAAAAAEPTPKKAIARPASLLPPKPLVKSSKPPTRSTFELPGEAVARRLKEEKEKRLSKQVTPEEAAAAMAAFSPSKPHAKSTKPPTRPTFELPGEAISRRKREEREAKLKAQEEEERKRREFKARPMRASVVPTTMPRETIASKARQGKTGVQSSASTSASTANKRHSLAAVPQSNRDSMTPTAARGRTSVMGSPSVAGEHARISRASSSTDSIHEGKRSQVSAEEAQQQRLRGREIYTRDNSYTGTRERERHEREAAAKRARQEAAERSRQLSREWALKQQKKVGVPLGAGGVEF